jgi:hypothetical protein
MSEIQFPYPNQNTISRNQRDIEVQGGGRDDGIGQFQVVLLQKAHVFRAPLLPQIVFWGVPNFFSKKFYVKIIV